MKNLTKTKLSFIGLGLLILNVLLAMALFSLDNTGYNNLDGSYIEPKSPELLKTVVIGQVISIPIICLILGTITTIFIEKEVPYRNRFVKGFLLTLVTVYGLFSVMGSIRVILLLV